MSALMPIDVHNSVDLAEAAANFIYEIKLRIYAAKFVLDGHDSSFTENKEDCLAYQLDDIYQLLNRQLSVFNDAVDSALTNQATALVKDEEAELLANFRKAPEVDQDFILVQSYFIANKYWTEDMRGHLSELAGLCVASDQGRKCAEVLLKDEGEGVLAGNVNQAQPSASIVNVVE